MPGPVTTQDLVDQCRDQLDEQNQEDLTDTDILQALNRGQRKAANILAKRAKDLLLKSVTFTATGSTDTFAVPEDAFGRRLVHVTVAMGNGLERPLTRVTYRDLFKYRTSLSVPLPSVYALKNRDYIIRPTPSAGAKLTAWYVAAPETLVLPQGRITAVNAGSNYVLLDSLGSQLTTSTATLGAFVNIVDAQTGQIKVSVQTNALDTATKRLTIKTSTPSYPTVYNRTISVALPATGLTTDPEPNDYVCSIQGTCVPDLPDSCLDFLIEYAVNEIRRRMGEDVQAEFMLLQNLEQDVERQWAGREAASRVSNKSRAWNR